MMDIDRDEDAEDTSVMFAPTRMESRVEPEQVSFIQC